MSNKKSVLVIGKGFLGTNIITVGNELGYQIIGTRLNSDQNSIMLDIKNIENIRSVFNKINPDCVIHCAVNGQIDYLEKHKELAIKINTEGTLNVAKICKENKIRMIYVSTDSVFDGEKGNYKESKMFYLVLKAINEEEDIRIAKETLTFNVIKNNESNWKI